MTRVIWCTPGHPQEAQWIAELTGRGFVIARRCVEAVDVLAASSIEPEAAVVLDIDTPRLSADVIAAIPGLGSRIVIALVPDEDSANRVHSWGVATTICHHDADASDRIVAELSAHRQPSVPAGYPATATGGVDDEVRGITTIYGPTGAPGRSTVALGLAEAWARSGDRVCLVDADTMGPSLSLLVGMTEEVSGVLVASRYADQGALDLRSLGSACRRLGERLWLMSGIGSPERWHQLRPAAFERVLRACGEHFDRVVVDTNPLVVTDEIDDALPQAALLRDCATRTALHSSTSVVAVTQPDPVNVLRLTVDLPMVISVAPHSQVSVVVNRATRRAASAVSRVREVLSETGISVPIHSLPEDHSVPVCRRTGSLMWESASTRRLRRSLSRLGTSIAA